jgi:hypothetical protein
MTHAEVLEQLGNTHALRAARIGHGCKAHQVRDWIRRGSIAPGWILHVAAASPNASEVDLLKAVTVYESNSQRPVEVLT